MGEGMGNAGETPDPLFRLRRANRLRNVCASGPQRVFEPPEKRDINGVRSWEEGEEDRWEEEGRGVMGCGVGRSGV